MPRRPGSEVAFVGATIVVTLALAWLSSVFGGGWVSAAALSVGMFTVLAAYAAATGDVFLGRLLAFGLAAGVAELAADCWLVEGTGTLVYPLAEPTLACSPAYMPVAWAVVLTQVGYLAWRLSPSGHLGTAAAIAFGLGVVFIPLFEHFAAGAGWWVYRDTPMVWDTPYYIVLGEGLICATLPLAIAGEAHRRVGRAVGLGVAQGVWIWAAYAVAYALLG